MTNKNENLFDQLGVEVTFDDVEVGHTYPLYGMITQIFETKRGAVLELNHSIKLTVEFDKKTRQEDVERLKIRAFEPGIFVSEIEWTHPNIGGSCKQIVFGKPQTHHA